MVVEGEWGKFVFKMVEPEDHEKVLEHLKKALYYPAFYRLGYSKEQDEEMDLVFRDILNEGSNLSFIAVEKATGKVAGCRIICMEHRNAKPGPSHLKHRTCIGILTAYNKLKDECKVFDRYNLDSYPHMFGISVDPEFRQQGLAIEIYGRAKALLKSKGHPVAMVAFISPYSRAAAKHHGFIQLAKVNLIEVPDQDGNILYPEADPQNFMDHGVFELN